MKTQRQKFPTIKMKGLKLLKTFVSISQEGESPTTNSKKARFDY